jgi:flagellar hook-associated protein 3 FlgL
MRVTENTRFQLVQNNLQQLQARQQVALQQSSTGRRIAAASEDPLAAAEAIRNDGHQTEAASYRKNISRIRDDVALAEGVLDEVSQLFQRAHEIAMLGANGATSSSDRSNLSLEVKSLQDRLVMLANSRGSRGALFAGSKTQTPAFDSAGNFLGDSILQQVAIGPGTTVVSNISGQDAFSNPTGRDVFADLEALRSALAANDQSATTATLPGLQASLQQVLQVQGIAGLTINRLDASDAIEEHVETDFTKRQENLIGADPVTAYSDLTQLGQALQRSIAVGREVLQLGDMSRF